MTRVLVCGGRAYAERKVVGAHLRAIHNDRGISLVIHGGASGADGLAHAWAMHARVPSCVFPANWRFDGRRAGPLRNAAMLELGKPDLVLAFPGGRGTADMIARAKAAGVPVIEVPA